MNFRTFFLSIAMVCLASCSSLYKPLRVDSTTQSYTHIRYAAIKALPLGLMSSSPNGRELRSRYFIPKGGGEFGDAIQNPIRHFAQIKILGERRPYTIEILVLVEKKQGTAVSGQPVYRVIGQDERLAKIVRDRFLTELAKRREDLNIIDDFRVF